MAQKYEHNIEVNDLGVPYEDCGRWRGYSLVTFGDTKDQLIENASISETDQDGGEIATYGLEDAPREVDDAVMTWIEDAIKD